MFRNKNGVGRSHLGRPSVQVQAIPQGASVRCCISRWQLSKSIQTGGTIGAMLYNFATMFTKLSLGVFYIRHSPSRVFSCAVYVCMAVSTIYCSLAALEFTFACRPMRKYWDFMVPGSCMDANTFGVVTAALNAATDIALLLLPLRIIWALDTLPVRQKLNVAFILMAGSL
jgi:hypothetical protein